MENNRYPATRSYPAPSLDVIGRVWQFFSPSAKPSSEELRQQIIAAGRRRVAMGCDWPMMAHMIGRDLGLDSALLAAALPSLRQSIMGSGSVEIVQISDQSGGASRGI